MTNLVIGELFSGAGGMCLGAQWAGLETAWACDIDEDACDTLAHNLDVGQVICQDATKLTVNRLEPIDGLAFGFPCNSFSVAGRRQGIADRKYGTLYMQGVKVLRYHKPLFFVAENVSGLASSGNGLGVIMDDLAKCGYDVHAHLFQFEEYGIPQMRHRILLIGFRSDLGIEYSTPPYGEERTTCAEALADIPADAFNHEMPKHKPEVVERLSYIEPGQNIWDAEDRLPAHLRLNKKGIKSSDMYRRMHPDRPAYTITAAGGGGTCGYHHEELRALTNRERARLQTFPDEFEFLGGTASVRKQIGMAVPPAGAQIIFESVLAHLESVHPTLTVAGGSV